MAKPKVFVSYDHGEDAIYRRALQQMWESDSDFDLEFGTRDRSVPVDSEAAAALKDALTQSMRAATHLLVIVGEKSRGRSWIDWEIGRAKQPDLKLRLVAIRLASGHIIPPGLLGAGTTWVTGFDREKILTALRTATNNY